MSDVQIWKKPISFAAVVLLTFGVVVTMPPTPAEASYYEEGVAFSGRIVRDSVPYKLRVKAIEAMGFTYSLEVSIAKVKDPAGVTKLHQKQTWNYDLEEGDFYWEDGTFHVEAGGNNRPFEVHIHADRVPDARCSKNQRLFASTADDGAFRIETGNRKFGTITELPRCAKVWSYGSGMQPPRCPLPGEELGAPSISVSERRDSDVARVNIYRHRSRTISGEKVMWDLILRGPLPSDRFRLDRDLNGVLAARGAPWLKGTARFHATGPRQVDGWRKCGKDREARSVYRSGRLEGDFTIRQIGYGSRRIQHRQANALRSWVRPRD